MFMSVPEENELVPASASDEQVTAFFRRHLPDFYFVNAPLSRMRRHLALLEALPGQPLQIEFARSTGADFTELLLCARDENQPGLLCKITGALATLKIQVHTAWIHTLRDPHEHASRASGVALNTLIVSQFSFGRARALSARACAAVTPALQEALSGRTGSAPRGVRRAASPLEIHELSAQRAGEHLAITLRAADTSGALFRVTHALASLDLSVEHAQINTLEREMDDVFFVSRAHKTPWTRADEDGVIASLRELLDVAPE